MRAGFFSLLCALAACGDASRSEVNGTNPLPNGTGDGTIDGNSETGPCVKMDLLFIVDDSGSMAEEQSNLASNFPKFIQLIEDFRNAEGKALDYRVAITTTGRDYDLSVQLPFGLPPMQVSEKGANGAFQTGSCGYPRKWLEATDQDVAGKFSCAAKLGTEGPSLEMPLEAIKLAFDDRMRDNTNAGFLRKDALLGIVILTDENDCSRTGNSFTIDADTGAGACEDNVLQPVDHYVSFLDQLKQGHGRWATSVIAGPGPGNCSSNFGEAEEAKRLKDFVNKAAPAGRFSSICDGDLTQSLKDALQNFNSACNSLPPPS